jgi:hypothetical protein
MAPPAKKPPAKKPSAKVAAKKPSTKAAAKKPPAKVAAKTPPAKVAAKKPSTKAAAKPASAKAGAKKPPPPEAWQDVLDTLAGNPGITRKGMFGADGLGLAGKYFAMTWKGALVAKLPRDRVDALVASRIGTHFDPGMGRPMREWIQVPVGAGDWVALAEEALAFVASLS